MLFDCNFGCAVCRCLLGDLIVVVGWWYLCCCRFAGLLLLSVGWLCSLWF